MWACFIYTQHTISQGGPILDFIKAKSIFSGCIPKVDAKNNPYGKIVLSKQESCAAKTSCFLKCVQSKNRFRLKLMAIKNIENHLCGILICRVN